MGNNATILEVKGAQVRDEVKQSLYDTIDIVAAESPQAVPVRSFFQTIAGKTLSQTNLKQAGQLENKTSFRILGMSWEAQNLYVANRGGLPLIMEHSSLQLFVGDKPYYRSEGTEWSGRIVGRESTLAAGPALTYQHHGIEKDRGIVLAPRHFIDIPPLYSFRVDWTVDGMSAAEIALATPAANTKLRYKCNLFGLLRRPVQ